MCLQEMEDSAAAGPFEDEDTRAFYESMPDLRAVVPAVLLGEVAPTDASDQQDASLDAGDSLLPDATVSEQADADAGEAFATAHYHCSFQGL